MQPCFTYRYYSISQSWEQAKNTCEKDGYYLAEITSLETLDKIRSVIGNDQIVWIGGKYRSGKEENVQCKNDEKFIWDYSDRSVLETIANDPLTIGHIIFDKTVSQ